jgi:phosphatidylglycerophosphatase A
LKKVITPDDNYGFASGKTYMRFVIEYYAMGSGMNAISRLISTVFFVGYVPFAPGTCGTLAACLLVWLCRPSVMWQLALLAAALIIGVVTSGITEKALGEKDSKHIVIDEFAGYLCSIIFLPLTPFYMAAAFILFRIFDIVKPPPVCYMEKIGGGWGIMLDDVVAGAITNIILQVVFLSNLV